MQTQIPTVDVINRSTAVTDDACLQIVKALQIQVSRDFAPIHGVGANIGFVSTKEKPQVVNHWQLVLTDTSDQAGALGYHDVTAQGQPLGKAFVGDDLKDGVSISTTISHELLEMLGDPEIDRVIMATDNKLYAYEMCDACEADKYGYKILDVLVSDFVTPQWFEHYWDLLPTAQQPKYDFTGSIHKGFELLPGGYIGYYDLADNTWKQATKQEHYNNLLLRTTLAAIAPKDGSRRARRAGRSVIGARWSDS